MKPFLRNRIQGKNDLETNSHKKLEEAGFPIQNLRRKDRISEVDSPLANLLSNGTAPIGIGRGALAGALLTVTLEELLGPHCHASCSGHVAIGPGDDCCSQVNGPKRGGKGVSKGISAASFGLSPK